MSRLLITIDTDNDAFQENGWQQEAARVLTQLAARLAYNCNRETTGTLRDTGRSLGLSSRRARVMTVKRFRHTKPARPTTRRASRNTAAKCAAT